MSQENSIPVIQSEIASEYGRYVESKSNKGAMGFFIKVLVIPFAAMLIIITGGAFAIANFSPASYTQAKDIIFAKVNVEKLTGMPDSIAREHLDSWLILNSEKPQGAEIAQELPVQKEPVQEEQIERPVN